MDLLFNTIEKVRTRLNPSLTIIGILPTMYDARTVHSREVIEEMRQSYGKQVFDTAIPLTVKLPDSNMAGQSIMKFNVNSPATKSYRSLAEEVEARGK